MLWSCGSLRWQRPCVMELVAAAICHGSWSWTWFDQVKGGYGGWRCLFLAFESPPKRADYLGSYLMP